MLAQRVFSVNVGGQLLHLLLSSFLFEACRYNNVMAWEATPSSLATSSTGTLDVTAAGRVLFIEHRGKRVLFVNYSHCDIPMLKAVAAEGNRIISREALNSVLTLNDVTGTSFDKESVAVLQSKVAANAPYVRRAAVIGISGLQRLIYEGIQAFSKRNLPLFPSRLEALDWLVKG